MSFDPYYQWLGIPPREQPPNHYRLLGIDLFEPNADVISYAADRQMAHLRSLQNSKHALLSQKLLNEVSAARLCLLDPARRATYDEQLRASLSASSNDARANAVPPPVPPPPPIISTPTASKPPVPVTPGSTVPVATAAGPGTAGSGTAGSGTTGSGNPRNSSPPRVLATRPALATPSPSRTVRRPRKNLLGELVKIMLGGAVGCLAGLAILWYGFGVDFLGLREKLPARWLELARIPPPGVEPTASDGTNGEARAGRLPSDIAGDATVGSGMPAGGATTTGSSGSPTDTRAEAAIAERSPAMEQDRVPGTMPRGTSSSGANSTRASAERSVRERAAIPSTEDQTRALEVLNAVHPVEQARTRTLRRELASKLLKEAEDSTASDVERFVMLKRGAELASDAGSAPLVLEALERMETGFQIDGLTVRERLLVRTSQNLHDEAALSEFVNETETVVMTLVRADRIDSAVRLTEAIYKACLPQYGRNQRKYVFDGLNALKRLQKHSQAAQEARQAIDAAQATSENLETLGRYLCLQRDDWQQGLPFLLHSSTELLNRAAENDLESPQSFDARLLLADLWYDVVNADVANAGFAARALHWYGLIHGEATGLNRTKISKRSEELRELLQDFDAREMTVGGLNRRATEP